MIHKKNEHVDSVPVCRDFQNGRCDYPSRRRWYKHVEQDNQSRVAEKSQEEEAPEPQGFWELPNPTKPPEKEVQELKEIMRGAMEMISSVNKKLETLLF